MIPDESKRTFRNHPSVIASYMLSTAVMIRLGRVEGNRMVHMQLTNDKLIARGTRMVAQSTGLPETEAREALLRWGSVKRAIEHANKQ